MLLHITFISCFIGIVVNGLERNESTDGCEAIHAQGHGINLVSCFWKPQEKFNLEAFRYVAAAPRLLLPTANSDPFVGPPFVVAMSQFPRSFAAICKLLSSLPQFGKITPRHLRHLSIVSTRVFQIHLRIIPWLSQPSIPRSLPFYSPVSPHLMSRHLTSRQHFRNHFQNSIFLNISRI